MAKKKNSELLELTNEENILLEKNIDTDRLKEELKDYVDDKINKTFIDELNKTNRIIIRDKSRRIIWKNVIIIILLAIIGFLLYLLFSNNYFDKYFNKNTKDDIVEKETKKEDEKKEETKDEDKPVATPTITPEPKKPTLDELIKEYGNLLDNYVIPESSNYLVDFYSGNLTDNLKKYITLNSFDFDTIKKEEDYQIIDDDDFKAVYNKLFSDEYTQTTFDYGDSKIHYISKMNSYMTLDFLEKKESNIKREIINIKVDDNIIIIETVEGLVKDGKLYEIINNTEVDGYKEDSLIKYKDELNGVIYTFKDNKLTKLDRSTS